MKFDVIVSGLNVVDILFTLPEKISLGGKQEIADILLQGGAPAGNAACTIAGLGLTTAFLGYLGNSTLNTVAKTELNRCGVDTSLMLLQDDHEPATAVVQIDSQNGDRTVFYSLKKYHMLDPAEIKIDWLRQCRLLLVDGYDIEANLQLLRLAKECNVPSVIDIESGEESKLMEMLSLASHSILPLECAQLLSQKKNAEDCLNILSSMTDGQLIVTDGANGSWAWTENEIIHQGIFATEMVDSTGCGDAYHGAYVYALLAGKKLKERMAFASAYASIIARYLGGRTYHPSVGEVEELLGGK